MFLKALKYIDARERYLIEGDVFKTIIPLIPQDSEQDTTQDDSS